MNQWIHSCPVALESTKMTTRIVIPGSRKDYGIIDVMRSAIELTTLQLYAYHSTSWATLASVMNKWQAMDDNHYPNWKLHQHAAYKVWLDQWSICNIWRWCFSKVIWYFCVLNGITCSWSVINFQSKYLLFLWFSVVLLVYCLEINL